MNMRFGVSTLPDSNLECLYALLGLNDNREIELPILFEFNREFGDAAYKKEFDITLNDVSYIDIAWKTKDDDKCFKIYVDKISSIVSHKLPQVYTRLDSIILGITSDGYFILWCEIMGSRMLLYVTMDNSEELLDRSNLHTIKLHEISEKRFCQYCYRINILAQNEEALSISCVKINSFDGSLSLLRNIDNILYNHLGSPSKILIDCIYNFNKYQIFIWFDLYNISAVFEWFYGVHPETKVDFIIRIDAENKKYELSLYRQGLKEPVIIPEGAYQLIVFKNKFEDYRSENYNQPRGAWIW